ncbi:DUF6268 family outer membrane beta-barrel protein [Gelidibacter japonicus]|uniref:DUF6268 family outer membrane beta-barrel protein n=1 Tax=Gelidibacter japonicus TaxID=1962232 RepID=UPI002AFDED71|nr:DUF6268 family outer membrane beta-barrel protein [Gelidibacter japonicus]
MKMIFNSLMFFGSFLIAKAQGSINTVNNEAIIKGDYAVFTDVGDVEMTNKSIQMNLYKTYTSDHLQFAISYANQSRRFKDMHESSVFNSLENSYSIGFKTAYTKTHKDNWSTSLSIEPQINSTFKTSLNSNDFMLGGSLTISKHWNTINLDRKAEMAFGLRYDTLFGKPILYPVLSYTHFINTDWNYTVGFPFSSVNYSINENQIISALIGPEGYYTNNSDVISINGTDSFSNSKLEFRSLFMGMDYQLKFDGNWTTNFGISYVPNPELRVLDTNDNEIYSFGSEESFRINFGVKYKLN